MFAIHDLDLNTVCMSIQLIICAAATRAFYGTPRSRHLSTTMFMLLSQSIHAGAAHYYL